MKINIALIPSREIQEVAIAASEELGELVPVYFKLGVDGPYPHVTLYSFECKPHRKTVIVRKVRDVLVTGVAAGLLCRFNGVEHHSGFLGVTIEKTEKLLNLHWAIIEAVHDQRTQKIVDADPNGLRLSGEQAENLRRFGYPDVGEQYNPHVTITRFPDHDDAVDAAEVLREEFDVWHPFHPRLGVFEGGEHGTCVKLIKSFDLFVAG